MNTTTTHQVLNQRKALTGHNVYSGDRALHKRDGQNAGSADAVQALEAELAGGGPQVFGTLPSGPSFDAVIQRPIPH